ncbi:hypothetical protein B1NLA3E_17370 [Bacillus sp. 1NLA3E]|nr:hypothetical protein B1NLA3E_17370 [Bacillus sp. 1NLA3E]
MDYLANMPQQIIDAMTLVPENTGNIIAWILCMTFGYLMYVWPIRIMLREKVDVFPIWLHCWMITIDIIGSLTFWKLAFAYDFFWLFVVMGIGLPIWVCMEAICISFGVKHNRQEEFGLLSKEPISEKTAWIYALGMVVVAFSVNAYALAMLGGADNAAIFIIYPFTNYVFAYWTWKFWERRGAENTRAGNSMGVQLFIVIQIALMWIPGLSWYLAVSPFFDTPWYYLCGIVTTALACYNMYRCSKHPKKELLPNGKKPIW